MRTLLMATAALSMTATGASAQRVVRAGPAAMHPAPAMQTPRAAPARTSGNWGHGPSHGQGWGGHGSNPGHGWNGHGPKPGHGWGGGNHPKPPRWGGHVGGRWWGGWRAPGGWGAYRRPVRGFILPSYWLSSNWYVNDWGSYGLPAPQSGYNWSRYYDDAVLIDGRGSVYDTIGGVNWDGSDDAGTDYAYDDGQGGYGQDYAEGGYDEGRDAQPGTPYGAGYPPPIPRGAPPPPHGAPPPPPHGAGYPPPPPPRPPRGGPVVVQSPGYYANGYYYPGATITTVTVTTTPVVTTTTEVFEDSVTYTPRPTHRKWRRHRTWHAKPKPKCICR